MKKLFKGEKKDFRPGLKPLKVLFACFCLSYSIFPQVPINGFCRLDSFSVPAGFNKFLIHDENLDKQQNFILYSPELNQINIVKYADEKYVTKTVKSLGYSFTKIVPVKQRGKKEDHYVFASRKNRMVGCFEILKSSRIKITAEIKFDSYPENICAADIDYDGNSEILVSGGAFKGLAILSLNKNKFSESIVEKNNSYGEAIFTDISNDGYKDIVAFNLFTNDIEIFYNDLSSDFRKTGSIEVIGNLENLSSADINKDFYPDLIYCSGKSINILKGDFQSSYDSLTVLATENIPHRYSIRDFNGDNFLDIAYADTIQGLLSIFFADGSEGFYPEVFYYSCNALTDIQSFKNNKNYSLALLSSNGKINIVSKIKSLNEEFVFVPALKPGAVSFVPSSNFGNGFCYIDGATQELIFILYSDDNVPSIYYSFPVSGNHEKLVVKSVEPYSYEICGYTVRKKLLETITVDLDNYKSDSHQLYIPGAIEDVKIGRENNATQIYAAFYKNNEIKINEYEYHDFRYTVREYQNIDENSISPLLLTDKQVMIYYWKADEDSFYQFYSFFRSGNAENNLVGVISRNEVPGVKAILQSVLSFDPVRIVSFLLSDDALYSVISGNNLFKYSASAFNFSDYDIWNRLKLNFENAGKDIYKSVYYSEPNKTFNKIKINLNNNNFTQKELFKVPGFSGFDKQKFSNGKEFLIYTQQEEGKITLKQLEK